MERLIKRFYADGYDITFSSASGYSSRSTKFPEVKRWEEIQMNSDTFNEFIKELDPNVVIFDRFITEEQFGWRVTDECPHALRILDTEDLHFLRKGREEAVKSNEEFSDKHLFTNAAKREIASIYRCDLSLIISRFEMELLTETFKIPKELLIYIPFQFSKDDPILEKETPDFSQRNGFMTIGNFRHAPNLDSVRILKKEIWPEVRKVLPDATLTIYGSYPTEEVFQMHKPDDGFIIKGQIQDSEKAFTSARVCLAPLRFGAGLKGKFLDAMTTSTPLVTSPIGAEGMFTETTCPGLISSDYKNMAALAVALHDGEALWYEKSKMSNPILKNKFTYDADNDNLTSKLGELLKDIAAHRKNNFIGQMLQFHTMRSTEFMSRFIQEKNKSN